jgi:hypothetical protein
MRFEAFIHNDEVTCFHTVVQGTQKVIMMDRHNFKDGALIERWQATQKTNEMSGKQKDENKQSNHYSLFSFVVRSHVFS